MQLPSIRSSRYKNTAMTTEREKLFCHQYPVSGGLLIRTVREEVNLAG